MTKEILSVTELRVDYGAVRAVRNVSLAVTQGEAVALIGPNGAGKTSTVMAIGGYRRPSGGDVRFKDMPIAGWSAERIARNGMRVVPEGRRIFPSLTVEENLRVGLTGARGRSSSSAIAEMYARFPALGTLRVRRGGYLSGGEQQQLAIARALIGQPEVIILDEPSLGLSPKMVDVVFETLAELRKEGVTVVLVEQNVSRALDFADRSYLLVRGRVQVQGKEDEVANKALTELAYLG
jgi:branched-chain amino acid transport system ATP-binding protein